VADDFDERLASALSPPERFPDRNFVARVQARIALEDQLAEERRTLIMSLASQVAALLAVTAGIALVARAPFLAGLFAESPGIGLAILLMLFSFVVLSLAAGGPAGWASRRISVT
jgi:hypothetical protein